MTLNNFHGASNFIYSIIEEDLRRGKNGGRVHTRFPPEPNGYLHIGHAKSICLNFGIAAKYGGLCNLRFDDTNPSKEEARYVEAIKEDIRWLGFDWGDRLYYASDYFDRLYQYAEKLIELGKAYVCDLSAEEIRDYRGTLTEPGRESPYRNRSVEENLDLFRRMKNGEFPDGSRVLRAKIDMASPNLNLRDPVIYRIMRADHHRTGSKWCIYPMYDYAHPLSDAIEGITHSICTLEFEDHRPLYNWFIEALALEHRPQQIEFARLNLSQTVMSKRKLKQLVEERLVQGWDDPRMPTISGLRRRGYTPEAIRDFCERIGVAKSNSMVEAALLEHCIRRELNERALRRMVVLRPLKVVIENYPEGQVEELKAENNPEDPGAGSRKLLFSREIYVERDDFREDPPKKFFRLAPGREVRLKHAYIIKCHHYIKDAETGQVVELRCTYDPQTKSGEDTSGKKVKGTLHWVAAAHALPVKVNLYDYLFLGGAAEGETEDEEQEGTATSARFNHASLEQLEGCLAEPGLAEASPDHRYQFLRQGYFCLDPLASSAGTPVFNRVVTLRDTWAKIEKKALAKKK